MSDISAKWDRRTWHRKASKPVTYWLIALLIAGIVHPILPEYRWVLIHLFSLGAITNSIVVWSQHFTEKFLHQPAPDSSRPAQLLKIRALNAGIIITVIGQLLSDAWPQHWIITCIGATIVGLALVWHAIALARQFLSAQRGQRFAPAVLAYIASACFLPIGAIAGGLLAIELPGEWQDRVLLAHTMANILGFLGFAALGSLSVLYAAAWRTKLPYDATKWSVALMLIGLPTIIGGVLSDRELITDAGLLIYVAAWLACMGAWGWASISVVLKRLDFASASVAAAPWWLVGSLIFMIFQHDIVLPTIALIVGFGAQLLIGVMSFLLPSTMGGGPGAVRTGTYVIGRAGLFRWVLVNGGLGIWLLTENSWLRVIASLLALGALAMFVPLMVAGVRAQRGVIMNKRVALEPLAEPRFGQVTFGISVLALLLAAFGGLGTTPVSTPISGDVYPITIEAGDMTFNPEIIEVPTGKSLEVTLNNTDTMVHDLKFANGAQTGRVAPGESKTIMVGEITTELEGWCTIAGHRAQGMDLMVINKRPDASP